MSIVQISKIQHRSGNLVDLPQLDTAELGWANDSKRLFIGTSLPNPNENIEVLTSYSNVSLSQVDGSAGGNLNITAAVNGDVLGFDGTNWVNKGGAAGGLITLGDYSNVKITGGAIGYVLETDGTGNLSWTSKGTLRTNIVAMSNATPIIMTVANSTPYTNGMGVTISGVLGANANSIVNGQVFYVKVGVDFPTSGNVGLYTDTGLTLSSVGTNLTATPNTGVAITSLAGAGATVAGGSNTSLQFNNSTILDGSVNLTYDLATSILALTGNANITGNVNVTGTVTSSRITSNVVTGTAPLAVVSTTLVPNLYVARANVADNSVVSHQATGTFYPTFASGHAGANYPLGANSALSFNAATGGLSALLLTGTLTTAAQPNITSTGTLTSLAVTGNISAGNVSGGNRITASFLTGTLTTAAQPNITSTGTLTSLAVTGNISGGNLIVGSGLTGWTARDYTSGSYAALYNANVTPSISNYTLISDGASTNLNSTTNTRLRVNNADVVVATSTGVAVTGNLSAANLTGTHYGAATGLTAIPGANVSGTVPLATTAGTVTTNAQPNITSVGTLTSLAVTGNISAGNVNSGNLVSATYLTGTLTTVAQPNVTSVGTLTSLAVTGNISGANLTGAHYGTGNNLSNIQGANVSGAVATATTAGTVTTAAQPNITSLGTISRLLIGDGTSALPSITFASDGAQDTGFYWGGDGIIRFATNAQYGGQIGPGGAWVANASLQTPLLTTGSNVTAGTMTGNWTLSAGSKLQATYADLAEYYVADAPYAPGTVLEFGGTHEVTLASDGTNRVAGVVSTNPAYVMNSNCAGEHVVALALQGRVPCKVRGSVAKGDLMISAGDGFARPSGSPQMGTIIGKAIADFNGTGTVEIAIGRL